MNICILALSDKFAFSGVWCLAAIPCLLIVALVYSRGAVFGAGVCATISIICALCLSGQGKTLSGMTDVGAIDGVGQFITNRSQTKWLKKPGGYALDRGNAYYYISTKSTVSVLDDESLFIPDEEIIVIDGRKCMKSTGERPEADDFYLYDKVYPKVNVPIKDGGGGIPQWVYHPAAPIWIFGFFGIPAFAIGAVAGNKLS